ncbi:MAG: hypothetical protein VX793_09405 [Pseudomonadota bacterium]|nr:hypothetical protein [Pseudomonadota bacterium]
MRIANGMLGVALCVLTLSGHADDRVVEDRQSRSHFGDYRLELEAAYENAAQSLDESLQPLLEKMNRLSDRGDGRVAGVQH